MTGSRIAKAFIEKEIHFFSSEGRSIDPGCAGKCKIGDWIFCNDPFVLRPGEQSFDTDSRSSHSLRGIFIPQRGHERSYLVSANFTDYGSGSNVLREWSEPLIIELDCFVSSELPAIIFFELEDHRAYLHNILLLQ
jgi:hypothetical protein